MGDKPTTTPKERLMHLLFDRSDAAHQDIKFMRGNKSDVTEGEFYDAVCATLTRQRAGLLTPVTELPKCRTAINVAEFIEAL